MAFTAAQIPDIEGRTYPSELAGELYPNGVPIRAEEELEQIVTGENIDEVWFSYSDVSHEYVMHHASQVIGWGAHFGVCSATRTMVESTKPVIAVTAVRTGVGKSQTSRYVAELLKSMGKKVVSVRHPMPYGDLSKQACQRFATYEDLDLHETTIEEREEYEPMIDRGFVVFAGVDYERILREAEKEADVVLWDGGNNDTPFYKPNLHIGLVDPHRPGHELSYYPGETNFRMADLLIVNKVQTAEPENVERVMASCREHNPSARIIQCRSIVTTDQPELIAGKRALVVEDGPTLTHGGMTYGAGWVAAKDAGASEIVDPTPYAVGSIKETYEKYPELSQDPAGHGLRRRADFVSSKRPSRRLRADVVVEGTPIDIRRVLDVDKPIANVSYNLEEVEPGVIEAMIRTAIGE